MTADLPAALTVADILAALTTERAEWQAHAALTAAASPALVGQPWVVLDETGDFGVSRKGDKLHAVPVVPALVGLTAWTQKDAEIVAGAMPTGFRAVLAREVAGRRVAVLDALIAGWRR